MGRRGRRWVEKKGKELKKRLKVATKSEKLQIVKQTLTQIGETYQNFIGSIPDVEARIKELEHDLDNVENENGILAYDMTKSLKGLIGAWEKVLEDLRHVRNRPKAMKLYYAKKVLGLIKKLKEKYPDE